MSKLRKGVTIDPDEQVLDAIIRAVAVAAVAVASKETKLINYPDQFLSATAVVAKYIKTGER